MARQPVFICHWWCPLLKTRDGIGSAESGILGVDFTDTISAMERDTILVRVSGTDRPGITAGLLRVLAAGGAEVLDMEQVVVRDRLSLGVLVGVPAASTPSESLSRTTTCSMSSTSAPPAASTRSNPAWDHGPAHPHQDDPRVPIALILVGEVDTQNARLATR